MGTRMGSLRLDRTVKLSNGRVDVGRIGRNGNCCRRVGYGSSRLGSSAPPAWPPATRNTDGVVFAGVAIVTIINPDSQTSVSTGPAKAATQTVRPALQDMSSRIGCSWSSSARAAALFINARV